MGWTTSADTIIYRQMKSVFLLLGVMFGFAQCDSKANISQNNLGNLETNISQGLTKSPPKNIQNRDKKMDKETLAKRVEPLDETVSQIIRAENATIQEVTTPFLRDGKIFKVSKFAPTRPIIIFIGIVGDDFTYLIGDEKKYFEFVKKSGVTLNSDELRKDYLLNFLEVTKAETERFQILESVADIKPRPNLNDDQKRQFAEFQEKYKSIIQPLKQGEEKTYKIFAVKEQNLIQVDLTIKQDDTIEEHETVLESNLLIPYSI
jgi:hypothetical protein